ncbi:MAG: hypothetical protein KGJ66_14915 [Alphaproteobacteria bacterium]|nr:hypothetical protein [Alphaproteobacteria bacterium]
MVTAFGVVSVHNLPILDAIVRRNAIRFVMARSEMGAGARDGSLCAGNRYRAGLCRLPLILAVWQTRSQRRVGLFGRPNFPLFPL